MKVLKLLIFFKWIKAQSQSGYNYPSPFNQLAPGAPGGADLGGVPGSSAQQPIPTTYPGSQPAYNNQPFTPSGNANIAIISYFSEFRR